MIRFKNLCCFVTALTCLALAAAGSPVRFRCAACVVRRTRRHRAAVAEGLHRRAAFGGRLALGGLSTAQPMPEKPGRPAKPELLLPRHMPRRSTGKTVKMIAITSGCDTPALKPCRMRAKISTSSLGAMPPPTAPPAPAAPGRRRRGSPDRRGRAGPRARAPPARAPPRRRGALEGRGVLHRDLSHRRGPRTRRGADRQRYPQDAESTDRGRCRVAWSRVPLRWHSWTGPDAGTGCVQHDLGAPAHGSRSVRDHRTAASGLRAHRFDAVDQWRTIHGLMRERKHDKL